jgi:hypothetical protein
MDVLYDPAEHPTHTRFAALKQSVNWKKPALHVWHARQRVPPTMFWYWPDGQSSQRNCRVEATNLPGTQFTHTPALVVVHEPLAQTCPGVQVEQSKHVAAPLCG